MRAWWSSLDRIRLAPRRLARSSGESGLTRIARGAVARELDPISGHSETSGASTQARELAGRDVAGHVPHATAGQAAHVRMGIGAAVVSGRTVSVRELLCEPAADQGLEGSCRRWPMRCPGGHPARCGRPPPPRCMSVPWRKRYTAAALSSVPLSARFERLSELEPDRLVRAADFSEFHHGTPATEAHEYVNRIALIMF